MDGRKFGTVKFVAVVENSDGMQFMVFTTGTDGVYRFQPIDEAGCGVGDSILVEKKRLRDDIRKALTNGWGNSYIGKPEAVRRERSKTDGRRGGHLERRAT